MSLFMGVSEVTTQNCQTVQAKSARKQSYTSFKGGADTVQIAQKTVKENKGKILTFLGALFCGSLFVHKNKQKQETLNIDQIRQMKSIIRNLKRADSFCEKDANIIKDALSKYSIDNDSASFVNECLDFIAKNKDNDDLYGCHEFGTGWIMEDEGCDMVLSMECALDKALDSNSPFNNDTHQTEGLKEYIANARKFMAEFDKD